MTRYICDRKRPWEKVDEICWLCGEEASLVIHWRALGEYVTEDDKTRHIPGELLGTLNSCERHSEEAQDKAWMDTRTQGSGCEPLRCSWPYHLTSHVFGLGWIGGIEVWIWNGWAEGPMRRRIHYLFNGKGWRQRITGKNVYMDLPGGLHMTGSAVSLGNATRRDDGQA